MKKILTLALGTLLSFGLFSCGASEEFKPKYDTDKKCEISIFGHYENFEAIEDEFIRFNRYYPNASLSYRCLDKNNYKKIITTSLKSETPPDIFFTFPWMIEDNTYSDLFEYTEDLSKTNINLSVIRDGLISKKNNTSPLVPIYLTTYGMMVNEDLFKKENIAIPNSYNELISSCQSFKDKNYLNVMMGYTSDILYPMFFPHFCSKIKGNTNAITELNNLNPNAGEYLRESLTLVNDFMSHNFINLEECANLEDDYEAVIYRFFEGDIPMMLASGRTVSGTEKRETLSEKFTQNPFKYSLRPIPTNDNGGVFLNSVNLCFSVNKYSKNLEMTNEFMRFLINSKELDNMSKLKRLMTPAKDMSLDNMYSSFNKVEAIDISSLGLNDTADQKIRAIGSKVAQGKITIDNAIANWTTIE